MARDFPEKLRLTLVALNCRTQKELLAKLLEVNPDTAFTPDRAYKWLSGAALPRDPSVHADLAAALGFEDGLAFYKEAPLNDFRARLSDRFPAMALKDEPEPEELSGSLDVPETLEGLYACFSPAWSVTKSGQTVLGTLTLVAAGDRYQATYSETHGGVTHAYIGDLFLRDTAMHGMLLPERGDLSVYFCLNRPSRAGLVLGGVFSGAALNDPFTRPCACRICCVALDSMTDHSNDPSGYAPDLESLIAALRGFGFGCESAGAIALGNAIRDMIHASGSFGVADITLEETIRVETLMFQVQGRLPT